MHGKNWRYVLTTRLVALGLTVVLSSCAAWTTPGQTQNQETDAVEIDAPDTDTTQIVAELAALTVRMEELETRMALLERALLDAAAPPPEIGETVAQDNEPQTTSEAAAPILLPTSTPPPSTAQVEPSGDAGAEPSTTEPLTTAPTTTEPANGIAVTWEQARNHLGESATVCGPVVAAQFAQQSNGQPTFLNIGRAFPAPERFQVVIWGNQRANFPTPPEIAYRDANVCVTGVISEYRGTVETTILGPDEIWIVSE